MALVKKFTQSALLLGVSLRTPMYRALYLLILAATLIGSRSYVESTPKQYLEGDHPSNYARIFREPIPSDVTVVSRHFA